MLREALPRHYSPEQRLKQSKSPLKPGAAFPEPGAAHPTDPEALPNQCILCMHPEKPFYMIRLLSGLPILAHPGKQPIPLFPTCRDNNLRRPEKLTYPQSRGLPLHLSRFTCLVHTRLHPKSLFLDQEASHLLEPDIHISQPLIPVVHSPRHPFSWAHSHQVPGPQVVQCKRPRGQPHVALPL